MQPTILPYYKVHSASCSGWDVCIYCLYLHLHESITCLWKLRKTKKTRLQTVAEAANLRRGYSRLSTGELGQLLSCTDLAYTPVQQLSAHFLQYSRRVSVATV